MGEVKEKGRIYRKGQPVAWTRIFGQFRRPLEGCGKL